MLSRKLKLKKPVLRCFQRISLRNRLLIHKGKRVLTKFFGSFYSPFFHNDLCCPGEAKVDNPPPEPYNCIHTKYKVKEKRNQNVGTTYMNIFCY